MWDMERQEGDRGDAQCDRPVPAHSREQHLTHKSTNVEQVFSFCRVFCISDLLKKRQKVVLTLCHDNDLI